MSPRALNEFLVITMLILEYPSAVVLFLITSLRHINPIVHVTQHAGQDPCIFRGLGSEIHNNVIIVWISSNSSDCLANARRNQIIGGTSHSGMSVSF